MLDKVKFFWQNQPVYLIYWISQNCNFTCEHCFNHEENKKRATELSLDEIKKLSSSFDHIKYLTLAGGEPFLRKDIVEIAALFCEQNDVHHLNVITNGWFTERVVAFCEAMKVRFPRVLVTMNVSIDGFEEQHDLIRQKKGSFKRCLETIAAIKALSSPQLEIAVNTVYNTANSETLESFAAWVVDTLGVSCAINLVRGESIQNEALRTVDIDHYLLTAKRIYNKNQQLRSVAKMSFESLVNGVQMSVLDVIEDSVKHQRMKVPCQAGKKGVVVTAAGDVLLCEILNKKLGNIRDHNYDIGRVLSLSESQESMAIIKKEKCHCTWECFQSLNTVFSPKMYPRVVQRTLSGF